jgi:hypothetical protein
MNEKIKEWMKRYLPAEALATVGAIGGASLTYFLTRNRIISAYGGAVGENIGYYGLIIVREYLKDQKHSKDKGKKHGVSGVLKTIRNLLVEFGVSELLDSLVVRPLCMYIFPLIIGQFTIGVIIGKFAADIVFYIPTIIAYELRKKHLDN